MKPAPDIALARLLQLASPALPVGAYSYSQGLEAAVEAGLVADATSAGRWVEDVMELAMARMELPVLLRLHAAWRANDKAVVAHWNALFLASRESAELRAETLQMGYSLARLLPQIDDKIVNKNKYLIETDEIAFPTAFACAAAYWEIEPEQAAVAYLWSWLENQVMAAIKAVPLGQTDGQRILARLGARLASVAAEAAQRQDEELGAFVPGLALLSSRHETQYSRIFRS